MKVTITVKDKHEIELNKDKLESIKKILQENVEIIYSRVKKTESKKLSSLSGLMSLGGDSVKDSDNLYE